MVSKLILKIPAYYKYVKIFKDLIEDILELNGISKDEIYEVKLAIAEAAVNVIKHSYCCECDKEIELTIEINEKSMVFMMRDFGEKVDIREIKSRDLDNFKENGLGVYIIKSVMDSVEYQHMKKGTLLTMSKVMGDGSCGNREQHRD